MDFLRTLHSYSQLVVPGDADGERNNDGDVRKAVVELNRFLGPHLDLALQYLCSAPAGTDAWVSAFVEGMAALSLDAGVARVLMSTLEALRATQRFSLFSQAASIVAPQVLQQVSSDLSLLPLAAPLLELTLLGVSDSPHSFHAALPRLLQVLSSCRADGDAAAASLATTARCLMHVFKGYDKLYEPLVDVLARFGPPLSSAELTARISAFHMANAKGVVDFSWPEGAWESNRGTATLTLKEPTSGVTMEGQLGQSRNSYDRSWLKLVERGAVVGMPTPQTAIMAKAAAHNFDALAGFPHFDAGGITPDANDTVVFRHAHNNYRSGRLLSHTSGGALIMCGVDKRAVWKPWTSVFWSQPARFELDVVYGPRMTLVRAGDVVFVRLGDDRHYGAALISEIAAGDDGKAKAWVKCFTGETSWAFSSRMRCCRSVVYTAPAFHHTGRISGVALQDDTTQQWIVDGTLQRVHQDRESTFNIRANRDGNVFTGQLNYGGLTERWLGIRSSPVSQFNLSPVLESGQCQDVPMLRFDSYTAVDVAAANRVVLGGWQTYTIEAWVCPTAPRVLLPSSLNEGNAGDNQVLQTIFSKANRGSRGELEFGLTPDLRVVARRSAGVTLVPPATMRIGEPAFLIFEVSPLVNPTKQDWIGLYKVGSGNRALGKRYYKVTKGQNMIEWAASKGPKQPGQYEFRYFKTSGYNCVVGVSPPFTVLAADDFSGIEESKVPPAGSSDGTVAITPTPLPLGEWSHVAVTFDGSALRVVVNGAEAASCPVVAFTPTDATTPCRIGGGCVSDKPQLGFHGFIAEVRAWDRALPPTELASQGRLRLRGCEPGLLGCWSMQSVDHLIVDRSPFCNHGLVVKWNGDIDEATGLAVEGPARVGHDLGDWVRPSQVDAAAATAAAPNPSGGAALSSPVVGEHHTSIVPAAGGPGLLLSGGAKLVGFLLDLWSQGHRQYRPVVASAASAGKANLAEVMASMERHAEQEERLANNEIDGEFVGAPVGLGHGGAAWVDHPVKLGVGFKAGFEITRLWPGCQISLVITQSTKWHVSPLDVFPDHLPPCTILVRVARLDIDRGVYDLSVTARGPEGDAVRLGEIRASGPEPARVHISAKMGTLRVSLSDTVLGRVEAPLLMVPLDLAAVIPQVDPLVWVGLHASRDLKAPVVPDVPTPASQTDGAGAGAGAGAGTAASAPPNPPLLTPTLETAAGDAAGVTRIHVDTGHACPFVCPYCAEAGIDKRYATLLNVGRHVKKLHPTKPEEVQVCGDGAATSAAPPLPPAPPAQPVPPRAAPERGSACVGVFKFEALRPGVSCPEDQAGDLRVVLAMMAQLEEHIRCNSCRTLWKWDRIMWRRQVAAAASTSSALNLLNTLSFIVFSSKLKDSWDDKKQKRLKEWRKAVAAATSAKAKPGEVASLLLELESGLHHSAFVAFWGDGVREAWRCVLKALESSYKAEARCTAAGSLADMTGHSVEMCTVALAESKDDGGAAYEWLVTNCGDGAGTERKGGDEDGDAAAAVVDVSPGLLQGHYTTTLGDALFNQGQPFESVRATMTFNKGVATALATYSVRRAWVLRGVWHQGGDPEPGFFEATFDKEASSFTGSLVYGSSMETFHGKRDQSLQRRAAVLHLGLRNLGNTCYQNSLIQTLFHTASLRNELLSCRLPSGDEPGAGMPAVLILRELQRLYTSLSMSQRTFVDPSVFHGKLPKDLWGNKKQQDSYEFLVYMWDLLESALPRQANRAITDAAKDLRRHLFGGVSADVTVCSHCGHKTDRTEPFSELQLAFPSNFTPVVDIALVSGPASTPAGPEGFERIQVDLNAGRKGVDPCFLYVRRAAKWGDIDDLAPITDITVIASKDGTAEPPQGYDRIPLNVNDQGSFEVYLCIRRSRSGSPITEIDVIHGPKANVEVPHAFTKVPHDLNKGGGGDYLYLAIKRGGHIRDIRLVTPTTALTSDGWETVRVDLSMDADQDDDASAVWLAYSSGGTGAPITDVRCVNDETLLVGRGWSVLGVLPGGRTVALRRGEGAALTSISVFRSPAAKPRYGYSALVDFGVHADGGVLDTTNIDVHDPVFKSPPLFHRYRMRGGDSFEFHRSDCVRVSGYLVAGIFGHDTTASVYDDRGAKRPDCARVKKGGTMYGYMYRAAHAPATDVGGASRWILDLTWQNANDKQMKERRPARLLTTVMPTAEGGYSAFMDGSFCAESKEGGDAWRGAKQSAAFSDVLLCRQAVTQLIIVKADAKVPQHCVRIARTPSGGSALLGQLLPTEGKADESPLATVGSYLCVARNARTPPAREVALVPSLDEDGLKRWRCSNAQLQTTTAGAGGGSGGAEAGAGSAGTMPDPEATVTVCWDFDKSSTTEGQETKTAPDARPYVMDVLVCEVGRVPDGYVGLRPYLMGGKDMQEQLCICVRYSTSGRNGAHPLEGTWNTSRGTMELAIEGAFEGLSVSGSRGVGGSVQGLVLADVETRSGVTFEGFYASGSDTYTPGFPLRWTSDDDCRTLRCKWKRDNDSGQWSAVRDDYLTVAYVVDSQSCFHNGAVKFSPCVPDLTLNSLIKSFHCPQLVEYTCATCLTHGTAERWSTIIKYPQHLMCVAKRFGISLTTGKGFKLLGDVSFPACLVYPRSDVLTSADIAKNSSNHSDDDASAGTTASSAAGAGAGAGAGASTAAGSEAAVRYGLYAVIVHAGPTLNKGHYYAFARDSAGPNLHLEDDPMAPWRLCNDKDVTLVQYADIKTKILRSCNDSAYMLFYRQLDGDAVPPCTSLPAEAVRSVVEDNTKGVSEFEALTGATFRDKLSANIARRLSSVPGDKLYCPERAVLPQIAPAAAELPDELLPFVATYSDQCDVTLCAKDVEEFEAVNATRAPEEPSNASSGSNGRADEQGSGVPPAAMERQSSAFDCPYCMAKIGGWDKLKTHIDSECAVALSSA